MKNIYMAILLCIAGCSSSNSSTATTNKEKTPAAPLTLHGLVYVDIHAPGYFTEHPLLTRDYYPGGTEMIFKRPDKAGEAHAIFPQGVTAPQKNELARTFTLHGDFKALKVKPPKKTVRVYKKIPDGYRYFLVSSWECSK